MFKTAIITASDKGFAGLREDLSGPLIKQLLADTVYDIVSYEILSDDKDYLTKRLKELCDTDISLILTTGGTGFSPRDNMPEATKAVIEKETPGIPEAMRAYSMKITPAGMLSRAAAGIRKQTLIVNLPGSPKAVKECLGCILPSLEHGLKIMYGLDSECART
ncbi:MogA/MoaB family molybdenum cofactor biosynthesis protein [Pectinatus haikarae]|uniref:MogA/MoaB family molybdenum cofactor biosynthesis protein n=1 Tax=Pectinatus haikarae TaxID=349096 RepID=UPI0018C4DB7A|nr:MogA/MoaB family molybdenum cofactor biosynthesis protein [Pectinatus haikarae]